MHEKLKIQQQLIQKHAGVFCCEQLDSQPEAWTGRPGVQAAEEELQQQERRSPSLSPGHGTSNQAPPW